MRRCRELISKIGDDECPFTPNCDYLMESCFKWLIDVGVRVTSQMSGLIAYFFWRCLYVRHFTYLGSMLVLIL